MLKTHCSGEATHLPRKYLARCVAESTNFVVTAHAVQAESSDGSPMVILESVPAGSILSELGFYCRDEANQPVHTNMRGKVQLSWSRGSKGVVLEPGVICLPDIAVSPSYCLSPLKRL